MNETSTELIREAQRVRARLRCPPNARPDPGIDLQRRPRLGFRFQGEIIPITSVELMQEIIVHRIETTPPLPTRKLINSRYVIRKVAEFYGCHPTDITGPTRTQPLVFVRQVASYLLREVLVRSLPEIGRCLNRDHTTVLHSVRSIKRKMLTDGELASDIAHLEAQLIQEMEGA